MNKFGWSVIRTLLFIVVGLMNTVFIKPDDIGSWKNYIGYLFLIIAAVDGFFIVRYLLRRNKNPE